ncbi:MAG: DUF4291 domain-containing protein [Bacteroidota bacterium]
MFVSLKKTQFQPQKPTSHADRIIPISTVPAAGRRAVHYSRSTPSSMFVYQAYKPAIANYAVEHQRFGGSHFSFNCMTWIKPNFMWMIYRSGWATKKDQERILRLELTRAGFETILSSAVPSSYQPGYYSARTEWETDIQSSDVRLQWDPDHAPDGSKLARRAIQLGIRGEALLQLNNEMLLSIADVTDFVATQRENIGNENLLVPVERVVEFELALNILRRVGLAKE